MAGYATGGIVPTGGGPVNPPGWSWGSGDRAFRDIGLDTHQAAERYGFRAFKVGAHVERAAPLKVGKTVKQKAPLRLVDHPNNGHLLSIYRRYEFGPDINVARCMAPYDSRVDHETAPWIYDNGVPHGCGFYAYGSVDHPDAQPPMNAYRGGLAVTVQGVVAGSGRRVAGTSGFLSEKLRILALAFPIECTLREEYETDGHHTYDLFGPRLERMIRTHYPTVAIFDSVTAMVREFPLTPNAKRTDAA